MLRCMSPVLALHVISRRRSNSVAFGVKRTFSGTRRALRSIDRADPRRDGSRLDAQASCEAWDGYPAEVVCLRRSRQCHQNTTTIARTAQSRRKPNFRSTRWPECQGPLPIPEGRSASLHRRGIQLSLLCITRRIDGRVNCWEGSRRADRQRSDWRYHMR